MTAYMSADGECEILTISTMSSDITKWTLGRDSLESIIGHKLA